MTDQGSTAQYPTGEPLCSECARVVPVPCTAPPEPPIGTWVRDRFGGVTTRHGNGHWAPPGCIPLASWVPMWHARGPLVECGKWGRDGN